MLLSLFRFPQGQGADVFAKVREETESRGSPEGRGKTKRFGKGGNEQRLSRILQLLVLVFFFFLNHVFLLMDFAWLEGGARGAFKMTIEELLKRLLSRSGLRMFKWLKNM